MNETDVLDARSLRDALGCFATGVTVVTTLSGDGVPLGMTMNSFSSVSLDPPLILFSLDRGSQYFDEFMASEHFSVNVLSGSQEALSNQFAMRGRDPVDPDDFVTWETGCPILKGALAVLECAVEEKLEGGDHIIFLCRVLKASHTDDGAPLLFHRGAYLKV